MTEPLLSVKNLQTEFRTREGVVKAVGGISFDLRAGETLGVVGESGSGKSVSFLSLMRLIPEPPGKIVGGEILFQGRDLLKLPPELMRRVRGDQISMIFQDPMTSLNPFLKISRQMTEVLEEHRSLFGEKALKVAIQMLDAVGIPESARRIHDYPHQFSGGMRQRVMIAMALLCQPKLLIADEPTTALDVTIQAQILELLKELQKEFQMAVVLITHNLGVAAQLCETIAVMYAGKIVEYGPVEEIFYRPKHPYTMGLLRSVPRLDEKISARLETIQGQPPDLLALPQGCSYTPRCHCAVERCGKEYPDAIQLDEQHYSRCWKAKELT